MAADSWGCGESAGPTITQFVDEIHTTANGRITVTTSANAALGPAKSSTLTLTPVDSKGAALVYAAPSSVQVAGFRCQPGSLLPKYLPGSCR